MPIYAYKCQDCEAFWESVKEMSSSRQDQEICPQCGAAARRKVSEFYPVYRGKGFHSTDYGDRVIQIEPRGGKIDVGEWRGNI